LLDTLVIAVATFFWLSYVPIAFISVFRLLRNHGIFVERDLRRIHNDPAIIFQITTRSATKTAVVMRGIQSIKNSAKRTGYSNYEISIVTDDPQDLITLADSGAEIIVVSKKFKAAAIKKGRALQYAVEHRRKTGMNSKKYWIFHMDDESCVTPQTILALLKFIREGNGIASEGPIFYPLKFELANPLTAIAESIRPFACYDCVSQMTHPPPLHMHGSNLLVRSDVEDTIGWNFGPTLAEDQMFGYKIYEKYGPRSMGWHGGILLEQPPLNIKDHFFQRRRWVLGTLQNIDKFPRLHRFKLMFKSVTYFLGFGSAVASTIISVYVYLPNLFSVLSLSSFNQVKYSLGVDILSWSDKLAVLFSPDSFKHLLATANPVDTGIGILLLFTSIVWLLSYQIGLFLNLRYSKMSKPRRFAFHLQTLLLCPIIGLVETFPAFFATIEYCARKNKNTSEKSPVYDFYVVTK
jgi:cellulose synthase/poly-beta-1,6-N-acetylglucosamine synthase-like glycosyltransferase